MFARTNQDVRRSLWRDVFESKKFGILVDQFRRQFALADLAKDAVIHRRKPPETPCRRLLQPVQSHYERIVEAPLTGELSRKALCLALRRQASHTNTIEA